VVAAARGASLSGLAAAFASACTAAVDLASGMVQTGACPPQPYEDYLAPVGYEPAICRPLSVREAGAAVRR